MSSNEDMFDKIRKRSAYYTYFFNNISSEKLLDPLKENGFFENATQAVRKDGYISYPAWPPAGYLIKVASKDPKKVMDIILAINPTDNQYINGQFIEAALSMTPDQAVRLAKKVDDWLKDPNLHLVPDQAARYVKHLYFGGYKEEALKISKKLLAVQKPLTESEKVFSHAHPKIGNHELESFIDVEYGEIFKADPVSVAPLLINSLFAALNFRKTEDNERDGVLEDYSEIWLSNFDKVLNSSDVETLLASKLYAATKDLEAEEKKEVILLINAEKYKVFKRMAAALVGASNSDKDLAKIYDDFLDKYGEPETEHVITSWTGPESPLSPSELIKMSPKEIIDYMNTWEPSGQIMSATKDGLGYQINQCVREDPDFAVRIFQEGTAFKEEYLDHIFSGLDLAARNKLPVNWDPVFGYVRKLVERLQNNLSGKDSSTILSALRMLQSAADTDQVDFTDEQTRSLYINLVQLGLKCDDPSHDRNEDPFDKSSSPDIGGINTTRGVALHTLIHFMKGASRQSKNEDDQLALFNDSELERITALLTYHLDSDNEPSFAVRTAYAHHLPYLFTSLRQWTEDNLSNIFPPNREDYFRVNVESFLRYSMVYGPIVPLVKPTLVEYLKHVKQGKFNNVDMEVARQLTSRLMIYYLNGEIELDDELLQLLFQLDSKLPAEAIEFVGRELKSLDPSKESELFSRAVALWDSRSDNASAEEYADFSLWFICDGFDLEWRKKNFIKALSKTTSTELIWQVFDWLFEHADEDPVLVSGVFDEIIRTQSDQTLHFTLTRDIEALLQKLSRTNKDSVNKTLSTTIDKLLAKNLGDYRKFKKSS